jgi:hypothetical protein
MLLWIHTWLAPSPEMTFGLLAVEVSRLALISNSQAMSAAEIYNLRQRNWWILVFSLFGFILFGRCLFPICYSALVEPYFILREQWVAMNVGVIAMNALFIVTRFILVVEQRQMKNSVS